MKYFQPPEINEFSGTILETGEEVLGRMITYDIKFINKKTAKCSKFILSKRLKNLYYGVFYTLLLQDGRKYTVYINDRHDTLIQCD